MDEKNGDNRAAISIANMEPDTGNASLGTKKIARFDTPVNVRVISYRKRLTDTDGVSVKAVLDGLVRAGVFADDSPEQIASITFENRKSQTEKTIIQITEL